MLMIMVALIKHGARTIPAIKPDGGAFTAIPAREVVVADAAGTIRVAKYLGHATIKEEELPAYLRTAGVSEPWLYVGLVEHHKFADKENWWVLEPPFGKETLLCTTKREMVAKVEEVLKRDNITVHASA